VLRSHPRSDLRRPLDPLARLLPGAVGERSLLGDLPNGVHKLSHETRAWGRRDDLERVTEVIIWVSENRSPKNHELLVLREKWWVKAPPEAV